VVALKSGEIACLIPARIGSTRFPGKPLTLINGRTMISIVTQNASKTFGLENTFVVTDAIEICMEVESTGANCILTQPNFNTGTDRIASVVSKLGHYEWIFNVQGDEPALEPKTMAEFVAKTLESDFLVTNAFVKTQDYIRVQNPNSIKMVISQSGLLTYASRSPIPSLSKELNKGYALQVCIYGFRPAALERFSSFSRDLSELEMGENIEILRFLDLGIDVGMFEVVTASHPVDVSGDVEIVERILGLSDWGSH